MTGRFPRNKRATGARFSLQPDDRLLLLVL